MKAVLYTTDFEPITVLNLNKFATEQIHKVGMLRIPVMQMPTFRDWNDGATVTTKVVNIIGEKFRYRNKSSIMLFTEDEETALLLKSEFLPGQTAQINEMKQKAYATGFGLGFLEALENYR